MILDPAADLGVRINAALTACPERGCTVTVPPGNYTIATPVVVKKPATVFLGAGTYTVTTSLAVPAFSLAAAGSVLQGAVQTSTRIRLTNGADAVQPLSGTAVRRLSLIGDCVLSGKQCNTGPGPDRAQGINSGSADAVVIEDVTISGFRNHGINTGGDSMNWRMSRLTVESNYNDGVLLAARTSKSLLTDSMIQYNGANGVDLNGSFNLIDNNTIQYNGSAHYGPDVWGVLIASLKEPFQFDADGNRITRNRIAGNAGQQILLRPENPWHHANGNQITANYISGAGAPVPTFSGNVSNIVFGAENKMFAITSPDMFSGKAPVGQVIPVSISGVTGVPAANGTFHATVVNANTLDLNAQGSGSYGGGGRLSSGGSGFGIQIDSSIGRNFAVTNVTRDAENHMYTVVTPNHDVAPGSKTPIQVIEIAGIPAANGFWYGYVCPTCAPNVLELQNTDGRTFPVARAGVYVSGGRVITAGTAQDTVIADNTVEDTAKDGIVQGGGAAPGGLLRSTVIRRNVVRRAGGKGILIVAGEDPSLTENTTAGNSEGDYSVAGATRPIVSGHKSIRAQ